MYLGTVLQFNVVCHWDQCYMRKSKNILVSQVYITIDVHVFYLDIGGGGVFP